MAFRAPALFIGHGSPMNTIASNEFTRSWRSLGKSVPKPRAILVISAHWFIGSTAVTAMLKPRTIHDFYGFPKQLFDFQYPAGGSPELAGEIVEAAKPDWIGLDQDQWGLDHGSWSVLAHLYPEADVPVVQLSINSLQPLEYHIALGARLSRLRDLGVMVLSSGNVVHNLGLIEWSKPTSGADWARRFDESAQTQMAEDPSAILKLVEHSDYARAVPTPDHFIPLLYTAGIAALDGRSQSFIRGCSLGSLSMTSFYVGRELDLPGEAAGQNIFPADIPAERTNT
jgi:4,5-DOPA dioxygenase extradiol